MPFVPSQHDVRTEDSALLENERARQPTDAGTEQYLHGMQRWRFCGRRVHVQMARVEG